MAIPHEPDLGRYQRQIGDRGGQQQLAERLRAASVARLPDAELRQSRRPMLGDLPEPAVGGEGRTALEGARLLQQGFLRVQHHQPAPPRAGAHAG